MTTENKHLRQLIDDLRRELNYQRRDINAQKDFCNMQKAHGLEPTAPLERFIRECDENANRLEMRIEALLELLGMKVTGIPATEKDPYRGMKATNSSYCRDRNSIAH